MKVVRGLTGMPLVSSGSSSGSRSRSVTDSNPEREDESVDQVSILF